MLPHTVLTSHSFAGGHRMMPTLRASTTFHVSKVPRQVPEKGPSPTYNRGMFFWNRENNYQYITPGKYTGSDYSSLDLASKPNSSCSQEPFGIYKAKNSSKTLPQLFGNARDKSRVSQMQRNSLPLRCISGLPCIIPFEVM